MSNLLRETLDFLTDHDLKPENIVFIGTTKQPYAESCTWEEFTTLSDFNYDPSYGSPEVEPSLHIIFKDGSWMERAEYDGSEWWEYKKTPPIPEVVEQLMSIKVNLFGERI